MLHNSILTGIKALAKKDSSPHRKQLFETYYNNNLFLRLIFKMYRVNFLNKVIFPVFIIKSFLEVSIKGRNSFFLCPVYRKNELNAILSFVKLSGNYSSGFITFNWKNIFNPANVCNFQNFLILLPRLMQLIRIAEALRRRYEFLPLFRIISFLCYYIMISALLKNNRSVSLLFSSDSNPRGIASYLIAKKLGMKIVYISQGLTLEPCMRVNYDLALLNSKLCYDAYLQGHCTIRKLILKSFKNFLKSPDSSYSETNNQVGIFLSKAPDIAHLSDLIRKFKYFFPQKKILVRPHPSDLSEFGKRISRDYSLIKSDEILTDIKKCEVIIAGNSSVHIDIVSAGIPAVYMSQIDTSPHDLYSLVKNRLILESEDINESFYKNIHRFYNQEWFNHLKTIIELDRSDKNETNEIKGYIHQWQIQDHTS